MIFKPYIWLNYLCLLCLCMVSTNLLALPSIELSQHQSGEPTGDNYLYSRAYDETVPLEQVLVDNPWKVPEPGVTNRGFSDLSSWMAFSLSNSSDKQMDLVLEYIDASVENIDVYYRKLGSSEPFNHLHYGFELPVETRSVSFYRPAFSLEIPQQSQYEVYIRIFQGNEMTMHCFTSFRIWDEQDFYRSSNIEMMMLIVLLCLELFMGIAAIIVYASTKDKMFLSYGFFVLSAAGLFAALSGLWGYFVMPNHYQLWMVVFKINICQIAALLFIRRFLNLKQYAKFLDMGMLALVAIGAFGLITNLLGFPAISRGTADLIAMFYILLIPIGIYAHKQGIRNALLFTFSWVIFIVGMMLASMRLSGLIPDNPFTEWMIYIGGFAEVFLLTTIMVLRIHASEAEKKVIQKELDIALANAQDNNKIKDKFLGVFSHELRTPLNGILGSLQLLGFSDLDESQKEQRNAASRSAKHLLRMVENILTFSELTSKKARSTLHDVNINTNIHGILNSFQQAANSKSIMLQSEIPPHVPTQLKLDWPNIQRILTYWLDNAIKFSESGTVSLNVDCEKLEGCRGYQIGFLVKDEGTGMAKETLVQVQQGFTQNNPDTIKNIDGLGLGLANSIKLAELIDARCTVTSTTDGTQYKLQLICDTGDEAEINTFSSNSELKRVLAVDDNPVNLMVLKQLLSKNGLEVDEATDGIEAVEMAKQNKYRVIFMDCQMPRMDGYQATRSIRESANPNQNTPIVAVTANAYDSDREHCLFVGMNDFVSKPIDQQRIMEAFRRWS